MKIFINHGHGGDDCGAVGNGLIERDVALFIAQRVDSYLQAVGYDVKLFQYDGLQAICDTANNWHADLFVSIHCNAFNGRANGTETIYYEYSTAGKKLAPLGRGCFFVCTLSARIIVSLSYSMLRLGTSTALFLAFSVMWNTA